MRNQLTPRSPNGKQLIRLRNAAQQRHVFIILLPLGITIYYAFGIVTASLVLQTLDLATNHPERVWLMPSLLRVASPHTVSGCLFSVVALCVGILGPIAGRWADRYGTKLPCQISALILCAGSLLTAWESMYLFGIALFTIGLGSLQAVFQALFNCQFEDHLTPKFVTYLYSLGNAFTLAASVLAGIQPFWLSYVQCAGVSLIGFAVLSYFKSELEEVNEDPTERAAPLTPMGRTRARGFGVLCVFTLLFFVIFTQFVGGAFLLFAKEHVRPLGKFHVPSQWFVGLNGLNDLIMAVPLVMIYNRFGVKFYTKFSVTFALMMAACALVVASHLFSPIGGTSPVVAAACIVLISLAELHYNPVMLAAISTEMPQNMVGLFLGIHFLITGVGGTIAGAGVPIYDIVGPTNYFGAAFTVSAAGFVALQLARPFLRRSFDTESTSECCPLNLKP